MGIVKIW